MSKTTSTPVGEAQPFHPTLFNSAQAAHEHIRKAAGIVSVIVQLLSPYRHAGAGLLHVDKYRPHPDDVVESDATKENNPWAQAVLGLRHHTRAAMAAWTATIDGNGRRVSLAFTHASATPVTCGPLVRGSYHDILLAIARIFLDTFDGSAVHPNEMGMAGLSPSDRIETNVGIIRLRLVGALADREWWQRARIELDREYAKATSEGSRLRACGRGRAGSVSHARSNGDPDALMTMHDLADETGVSYSTISSRRTRKPANDRPKCHGTDDAGRMLFRRSELEVLARHPRANAASS